MTKKITDKEVLDLLKKLTDKPSRNLQINKDDILNLQIALNTSKSLEEFLALV